MKICDTSCTFLKGSGDEKRKEPLAFFTLTKILTHVLLQTSFFLLLKTQKNVFHCSIVVEGSLNLISLLRINKQGNQKGQLGLSDPGLPKLIAPSKELGSKGGEVPTETSQVKSVGVYYKKSNQYLSFHLLKSNGRCQDCKVKFIRACLSFRLTFGIQLLWPISATSLLKLVKSQ